MSEAPPVDEATAWRAVASLYHSYFTGLILTVASRRGAVDAGEWTFRIFRHQHQEKFLPGLEKLGLTGLPHAVACAGYHFLSNSVGGVQVEFMRESDTKAWVRFVPPRWVYEGAAICGVPSEVSRGMLRGWYAQNGVSLKNPRLGFVCTAQTTDGQYGLAGYFREYDRDLAPEERLRFAPGEEPPPFDPDAALRLPEGSWPPERLAKASRNYAMEYVRTALPRLAELFGPAEATHLGNVAGRLIGLQHYHEIAGILGVADRSPRGFAGLMAALIVGQGDRAEIEEGHDEVLVRQIGWRLTAGLGALSPSVFEGWNGLWQGMLDVHDRFLVVEVLRRLDHGDPCFEWRIRRRPRRG
ncbi:MAG: hypothetical protein ACK4QW_01805 [Alphaproteobacteria bacterium]